MESTPAEVLPDLYRAILDAVAQLEANGQRRRAAEVRRAATAAYSRAWDARAQRRLESLLRDAARPAPAQPPRRGLSRRLPGGRRVGTSLAPAAPRAVARDG